MVWSMAAWMTLAEELSGEKGAVAENQEPRTRKRRKEVLVVVPAWLQRARRTGTPSARMRSEPWLCQKEGNEWGIASNMGPDLGARTKKFAKSKKKKKVTKRTVQG
jgi:hypothetical protein